MAFNLLSLFKRKPKPPAAEGAAEEIPSESASDETLPEEDLLGETLPEDDLPDGAVLGDTLPEEDVLGAAPAEDSFPRETQPTDASPPVEAAEPEPPPAWDPFDIDMDRQIDELLMQDQAAEEDFKPLTETGMPREFNVYDGMDDNEEVERDEFGQELVWTAYNESSILNARTQQAEAKEKDQRSLRERIMAMSPVHMAIAGGIILFVILSLGIGAALIARAVVSRRLEREAFLARYTLLSYPKEITNNTNFIYVNEMLTIGGQRLTLQKISAGPTATWFYFKEDFDPDDYDIKLYDQTNTLFHRYRQDGPYRAGQGTALKFEALKSSAIFLTLSLLDIETRESASFNYRFEQFPVFEPPTYINGPEPLWESGSLRIQLEQAVFSSDGTEVNYSLVWSEGAGELRFKSESGTALVALQDGINRASPTAEQPTEALYPAWNVLLGRLCFSPVRSTNGRVELELRDLFYTSPLPPRKPNLRALYTQEEGFTGQSFRIGGYTLVLEGLDLQGDYVVLVLHGTDAEGNRLETLIEAELTIETDTGDIVVPAECRSSGEGSDVLFNIAGEWNRIKGVPISRYSLDIKNVQFNIPRVTAVFDLSAYGAYPDRTVTEVKQFIRSAFLSRLAYKSHAVDFGQIKGFEPALLQDRLLMRNYTPVITPEMPLYSAQVLGGTLRQDGVFLAIVEDEWHVGAGEDASFYYGSHQVTVVKQDGQWVIVEDIVY